MHSCSRLCVALIILPLAAFAQDTPAELKSPADPDAYFGSLRIELRKTWPRNRRVRFVFHGHSVPAGYFKTPAVDTFNSYPTLFHRGVSAAFPTAVIDVSVTAIGGEHAESGSQRFARDVLSLRPDVVAIDYSLNDRRLGLERAEAAWRSMIEAARKSGVRVMLLTPTPDQRENPSDATTPLAAHAEQVRKLAAEYGLPLIDSYAAFGERAAGGTPLVEFMSQVNHPNRKGHDIVTGLLIRAVAGEAASEE